MVSVIPVQRKVGGATINKRNISGPDMKRKNMTKSYTIIATLNDDVERLLTADFLELNELEIVQSKLTALFDKCDRFYELRNSMSDQEWDEYEESTGAPEMCFPYPYFILDNIKHRDLICYLSLAGIGISLTDFDLPNALTRNDVEVINLVGATQ